MDWAFHTHGWAYNFISQGQARNHHAHPRPASRTPPASKGSSLPPHWPAPAAHGPPGQAHSPPRRTATLPQHAQDSQAQYGFTSGCSQRIHSALRSRPQLAPARLGPAPLTRITHGPIGVTPFATQMIDLESRGQGVFLQMGGPPNTFTGATQPIPVGSDGSVQAGLPDANTGRDTRGVVNKYSTLRCVSPHAMRLRVR